MMEVVVRVNRATVTRIEVRNRGPIDGRFDEGDHPGGDGPRLYEWTSTTDRVHGTVLHTRGDGPDTLAMIVLAAHATARARRDNATLTRWKNEATQVLAAWDDMVEQANIVAPLGTSRIAAVAARLAQQPNE